MTSTRADMTPTEMPPVGVASPVASSAGLMMVIAGAVQGDGAILTAAYRGDSPVSDDRLSFPWDGATAVTTSSVWGLTQVLIVLGLVAFARSGIAGGRSGRVGAWAAVAGAVLYVAAHALSLVAYDGAVDDPAAIGVFTLFGIGTVLTAVGLCFAGAATVRSGPWLGWRRFVPLALGGWMVVMTPLQFTPLLPVAVGVYAALVIAFGVALLMPGGRLSSAWRQGASRS